MKIIISPAKKMRMDLDSFEISDLPKYLAKTERILKEMQNRPFEEMQRIWQVSDRLAEKDYPYMRQMNLHKYLTPALFAYAGPQYQYMAPNIFTQDALDYVEDNLFILSGFYGILHPFDGIVPYRLELQDKLSIDKAKNLFEFWGKIPYQEVSAAKEPIVNLLSLEYSKIMRPYLQQGDQFIDMTFGQLIDGRVKSKATSAKIARGEMVRYMAENNIQNVEDLKKFDQRNYHYVEEFSSENKLVFIDN